MAGKKDNAVVAVISDLTDEQAAQMASISDGAIVGSAIIKIMEKYGKDSPRYVGEYVKSMKDAIRGL